MATDATEPHLVHWLTVAEMFDPDDGDHFELEHDPRCPLDFDDEYGYYTCAVGFYVADEGLGSFFEHRDAPAGDSPYSERLAPGRYQIEAWDALRPGGPWAAEEWEGGLRLVGEVVHADGVA